MNANNLEDLASFATNFIQSEVKDLLNVVLGDDRSRLALDLIDVESMDFDGCVRTQFELEKLLERCHDFAFNAIQGSDDKADQEALEAFYHINLRDVAVTPSNTDSMAIIGTLLEAHHARMTLEFPISEDDQLTREQISLLSGLAVETIRLAGFAEGDDYLPQQRPGIAKTADVKRWLKHKGRYQGFKRVPPQILKPTEPAQDERELAGEIRRQTYRHLVKTAEVFDLLPSASDRGDFEAFFKNKQFDPERLDWVTTTNATLLGKHLMIDAKWLFENLHRLASQACRERLLAEMENSQSDDPLHKAPNETVVTPDLIRRVLRSHDEIQRHPTQKKPNVKLDGYMVSGGQAFAHEHNGKSQFFWVPESLPVSEDAVRKHYPAVGSSEPMARHSGLSKFPELARTKVKKVHVRTPEVLNEVVEALLKARTAQ
ncbi:hypothetical protein FWJ25_13340 [Marinobacter salinexigens]|uniref:Uncharacterized protein n=1 Tax=Marinobacter salinexigens TaxID=2919747 RepID=A0A5B0VF20_9GAMM|nr:hypothetical protein [Marinobacter salinexigens]KAA1172793.1 hypothetical protein FWJ25_13340 [Marinobacter salinexigens]